MRIALLALAVSTAACQLYFTDHSDHPEALGTAGTDGGAGPAPDGGADHDGGGCNGSGYLPDGGVIAVPDAWPASDGGICCNNPPDAGSAHYPDASAP